MALAAAPDISILELGVTPMLEFDEVSKRFGSVLALDACSFTAHPGRLTGFLGPNGAGKTTAMRAVFGLVEPDTGAVSWRGLPIGRPERARFGYMPEERGLYPRMRVREQLLYLGELAGRPSRDVARSVDGWLARLGLASRGREHVDALSHGNQQRVQLIAALVNEPDLLVLDEPFSGLDPLAMANLSAVLAEIAGNGVTILFSSHQLDLVEDICDDVVIIDHGRVVATGDLADLRAAVPHRFVTLHFRGEPPDWSATPLVDVVEAASGTVRLRVPSDADVAGLARYAREHSDLVSFTYEPPSLSELFRQAVSS